MAKFQTQNHSFSYGGNEFTAVDGVVEIPDEYVHVFAAFIGNALLPTASTAGSGTSGVLDVPGSSKPPKPPKVR